MVVNAAGIVKTTRQLQRQTCKAWKSILSYSTALHIFAKDKAPVLCISARIVCSGEIEAATRRRTYRMQLMSMAGPSSWKVEAAHCLTLRTSIIGLELHRKTSLIEWFLASARHGERLYECHFHRLDHHGNRQVR